MNQHCGKHDKIFNEANPCPGCENERAGHFVSSAEQIAKDAKQPVALASVSEVPGVALPEHTEDVVSNLLKGFERTLRNALKR